MKTDVTLHLTHRQAVVLEKLLMGELARANIEQHHRRAWEQICKRLDKAFDRRVS